MRRASAAVAALLLACAPGDAPTADADVGRDSAGVRIVENGTRVGWPGGAPPSLDVDLEIGTTDGAGSDGFGNVVATDVDSAGRIYVLDQQAGHVAVFDGDGRHERTLGRPGSGPGELSPGASGVFVGPDGSVVVPDLGNARVTRFAVDGPVTSWPLGIERGVPVRWDGLPDGTLVAQLRAMGSAAAGPGGSPLDPLVRYGPGGAVVDTILSLPAGTSVTVAGDGVLTIRLFEPEPLWDLSAGGALAWATNSTYEIRRHGPDGALAAVVRREGARRPVSERDRSVLTELVREMMVDQGVPPAAVRTITERMRIADWFPALAAIHVAPDGAIWVQQVAVPSEVSEEERLDPMNLGSPDWDVFDTAGRWLGTLRLPERFTMTSVTEDALYGVVRDDLDVQRVVRIRVGP